MYSEVSGFFVFFLNLCYVLSARSEHATVFINRKEYCSFFFSAEPPAELWNVDAGRLQSLAGNTCDQLARAAA